MSTAAAVLLVVAALCKASESYHWQAYARLSRFLVLINPQQLSATSQKPRNFEFLYCIQDGLPMSGPMLDSGEFR